MSLMSRLYSFHRFFLFKSGVFNRSLFYDVIHAFFSVFIVPQVDKDRFYRDLSMMRTFTDQTDLFYRSFLAPNDITHIYVYPSGVIRFFSSWDYNPDNVCYD